MKHGENIQFIPDRDRGDGGLEAYRLDESYVYQCYAPQNSFDVTSQTDAQKAKISKDIKKLSDDLRRTRDLLGQGNRVTRWVLLTPEYDSKSLISYARSKSKRVRETSPCPEWCDPDLFEIVVHSDELFAAEAALLYGVHPSRLDLDVSVPDQLEINAVQSDLRENLTIKLAKDAGLRSSPGLLSDYMSEVLLDYVRGIKQRSILSNQYSMSFQVIERNANSTLRNLTRMMLGSKRGAQGIEDLTKKLSTRFHEEAPGLSSTLCEELARYYVAEWLLQCPLRLHDPLTEVKSA